jgi:hypothetical protein
MQPLLVTALVDKLVSSGFQKFGCIYSDPTVGSSAFDAVFLAAPSQPTKGWCGQAVFSERFNRTFRARRNGLSWGAECPGVALPRHALKMVLVTRSKRGASDWGVT